MLSWTPCRWRPSCSWRLGRSWMWDFPWDVILKNWGWNCATWEPERGINVSLMYILASFSICENHKRCHFWALAHFLARLHPSAPVILFSLRVWGEMTGRGGRLESRHARNAEPPPPSSDVPFSPEIRSRSILFRIKAIRVLRPTVPSDWDAFFCARV